MSAKHKESKEGKPTLAEEVRNRIGKDRIKGLATQPLAIAGGGVSAVIEAACKECAGYPSPAHAATVRTLQLCGSKAKPEDLEK